LTRRAAEVKNKDFMKGRPNGVTKGSNAQAQAGAFSMRRRIGSTTYEVTVYFSPESGETLDDKILRMIRNEAEQE
jgi:hypothetical protein